MAEEHRPSQTQAHPPVADVPPAAPPDAITQANIVYNVQQMAGAVQEALTNLAQVEGTLQALTATVAASRTGLQQMQSQVQQVAQALEIVVEPVAEPAPPAPAPPVRGSGPGSRRGD